MAIGWLLGSLLVSLLLVQMAIGYAHRRGMLDQPGQRRSHTLPTPRGGGIGIVLTMLVCIPGTWLSVRPEWSFGVIVALTASLALVALSGWWDDHHALPVLPRLGAQLLACGIFSIAMLASNQSWWWLPLLVLAGTWSINLHNFMDGIDGLLAQQTIFVTAGMALLAWSVDLPGLALAAATLTMASVGFWIYNRPPARIFMGDVGSGSVGLLLFAYTAMLWSREHALLWPCAVLSSAFVVDASLTLLIRIWHGRRWYSAHREHLYQWLTRCHGTHAWTDAVYMGWNILVAAPLAWLARSHLHMALPITMGTYLVAAVMWLLLKRRCLRRHLPKGRHVVA